MENQTVQLLHALDDLVDVLPHDVLNIDQTLVDLVVAVQVARLVVVLTPLLLDLLVWISSEQRQYRSGRRRTDGPLSR